MILQEVVGLMDVAIKAMDKSYGEIKICELGDQRMKWNSCGTGKKFLLEKGVTEHTSIDLNGKNGALKFNLAKPIDKWKNYFDMVTNYGTTEHVSSQYDVFQNIHNFTKVGGSIINTVPIVGGWARHCDVHYETSFFEEVSEKLKYDIIYSGIIIVNGRRGQPEIDRSLVCSVLIKREDAPFIEKNEFDKIGGINIKGVHSQ